MTAPAVVIRLEFEAGPKILCDWLDDREADRMLDWLDAHPEYHELIARAYELAERRFAA